MDQAIEGQLIPGLREQQTVSLQLEPKARRPSTADLPQHVSEWALPKGSPLPVTWTVRACSSSGISTRSVMPFRRSRSALRATISRVRQEGQDRLQERS